MSDWRSIPCQRDELRLDISLVNGQSFRWKETSPGQWTSVLDSRIWTLSQTDDHILYKVVGDTESSLSDDSDFLRDYFQLGVSLSALYEKWNERDPNFRSKAVNLQGARVLRQDPVENLFSFICSSNNNISRISQMVGKMCMTFGEPIEELDSVEYYGFPSVDALAADGIEQRLRELGFGYRAKFIAGTAKYIQKQEKGSDWLRQLRKKTHDEAKTELMKLPGVGAKVADCVCLMSLDKTTATPVDTHVWQIATRDYNCPGVGNNKSLTDKIYKQIGDFFTELWGDYAGWAQCVLFSADLKKFQEKPLTAPTNKRKHKKEGQKLASPKPSKDVCAGSKHTNTRKRIKTS